MSRWCDIAGTTNNKSARLCLSLPIRHIFYDAKTYFKSKKAFGDRAGPGPRGISKEKYLTRNLVENFFLSALIRRSFAAINFKDDGGAKMYLSRGVAEFIR